MAGELQEGGARRRLLQCDLPRAPILNTFTNVCKAICRKPRAPVTRKPAEASRGDAGVMVRKTKEAALATREALIDAAERAFRAGG